MSGSVFKKVLLAILVILLVAIWIRNLFMVVPATQPDSNKQVGNRVHTGRSQFSETAIDTSFSLDLNVRDPFEVPKRPQPKSATTIPAVPMKRPVETIRASLKGHVFNAHESYIVALDSVTEITSLYRTGDTLNGFVLKKIARSEILWKSQKGRRLVWKTNE